MSRKLYRTVSNGPGFLEKCLRCCRTINHHLKHHIQWRSVGRFIFTILHCSASPPRRKRRPQIELRLSDFWRDQTRQLWLNYSMTTDLEPINFDLSIFFITSPPVLVRESS